jgi:hypothetical protein
MRLSGDVSHQYNDGVNRMTVRQMLPGYPVRVDFWRSLPSSREQTGLPGVRLTTSLRPVLTNWEYSRQNANQPKPQKVVLMVETIVVAIRRPTVPRIVVPRTAARQLSDLPQFRSSVQTEV